MWRSCLLIIGLGISAVSQAQSVLLIYDKRTSELDAFVEGLRELGPDLTLSADPEYLFDGTNPKLEDFDAVVHLNAQDYDQDMSRAGQEAIMAFVRDGGFFVASEWSAYERSRRNHLAIMDDLVLHTYLSGTYYEDVVLTPMEGTTNHPIALAIGGELSLNCMHGVGPARAFDSNPPETLLQDQSGNAALSVRRIGDGLVAHFYCALNLDTPLRSPDLQNFFNEMISWGTGVHTAGSMHNCVIQGGVRCWGANASGQLGTGDVMSRGDQRGEMGAALVPVALGDGFTPVKVFTGGAHSCALSSAGQVKCWGDNRFGQLGLGDVNNRGDNTNEMGNALPAVDLGSEAVVTDLALGSGHTCALLTNGNVHCWGANDVGQLGLGDAVAHGDAPGETGPSLSRVALGTGHQALAIGAGRAHTCVLLDDASVRCWGNGSVGQLGSGATLAVGTAPNQMGDALRPVDLGGPVRKLAVGVDHNCALLTNGTIKCWGQNNNGELGVGDTLVRGDEPGEMGNVLPTVDLGRNQLAESLVCGGSSCCATFVQRTMKCWGKNLKGQLGLGDLNDRGSTLSTMGDELPFLDFGALATVTDLRMGLDSTCAKVDDVWKCWGNNSKGQLGSQSTAPLGGSQETVPRHIRPVDL